jgi:DUF4097 and DUF4098 domain-containing protein YvlB
METRRLLAVAVCTMGLSGPLATAAAVQRQVEHGGDVAADVRVEISNVSGSVRVTGWERDEIRLQGTLGEGVSGLSFENDFRSVEIDVEVPRRRRDGPEPEVGASHLEISVPRGAYVEIETLAASISVLDVDGDVRLESTAGGIVYSGGARRIEAGTAAGDIEISSSADGADIDVEGVAGGLVVQFASAHVRAATVTGQVRLIGGRLTAGELQSVSGLLYLEGEIASGADLGVENFSGDIELLVPDDTSARFDITTYSGSIQTDFGYEGRRVEPYSPEQQAEFTLGNGGATVDIETFAGKVMVRRR